MISFLVATYITFMTIYLQFIHIFDVWTNTVRRVSLKFIL